MRRRRVLPSGDPPVRACTVAPCRREPRRISLAASAAGARSLGAVSAACGRQATGITPTCTGAERRIRGMSKQSLSDQGPLNASLDAATRHIEGDLREHGYYPPPC